MDTQINIFTNLVEPIYQATGKAHGFYLQKFKDDFRSAFEEFKIGDIDKMTDKQLLLGFNELQANRYALNVNDLKKKINSHVVNFCYLLSDIRIKNENSVK